MPGSFKLLQPGPQQKDEYRGDVDLFAAHHLSKIAEFVLSGRFPVQDYLKGMPDAREFRRGPGMELAPLADLLPSSAKPGFAPLSPQALSAAFTLQPGPASLPDADLGLPVDSTALGSGPHRDGGAAPGSAPAASGGPHPSDSGATTATTTGGAAGATATGPSVVRLKIKVGGVAKGKRR